MTKIAGITIERTLRGKPRYVRIDLNKFPEIIPLLREKGVLDEIPNKETVKAIKEARNTKKLKKYTSVDELFNDLDNGI